MQSKTLQLSSPHSQALSALERWQPQNPSPLAKGELSTLIAELSGQLQPATKEDYALAMAELIQFASAFGIPCPEPTSAYAIYREQLQHLPADLLRKAVLLIKQTWVWRNAMPMPADLLNMVKADYAKRQLLLGRAQVALLKAPEESGRKNVIRPEQWVELRKSLVKTTNRTSGPCPSFFDAAPDEDEPDMTQAEHDARRREIIDQCEGA